jgi:hypothetical protein
MRAMRRLPFLVLVVLLMLLVSSAAALAAPGGNSAAAHACRQGGFTNVTRDDGTTFRNAGECTSHAARGGTLKPLGTPARLWIEVDTDTMEFLLLGEGLLPGSDVGIITHIDIFGPPPSTPAVLGVANVHGEFSLVQAYICDFIGTPTVTVVTLFGTAADGSPVSSESMTAPCS